MKTLFFCLDRWDHFIHRGVSFKTRNAQKHFVIGGVHRSLYHFLWNTLSQRCLPGLLEFRRMNIRSPRSIVLNDLRSFSELVGAPPIGHRRIFGAGHFLFLREIEFQSLKSCYSGCFSEQ
jgi:hypothetical protein